MPMQRPAKPDPMIATPTSRTAPDEAGAGAGAGAGSVFSSVLVTDRLLEVVGPGLLSNAQQATTVTEQRSIRAPGSQEHRCRSSAGTVPVPPWPAGRC